MCIFSRTLSSPQGWNMFDSPHFNVDVFAKWRDLLRETESTHVIPSTDE